MPFCTAYNLLFFTKRKRKPSCQRRQDGEDHLSEISLASMQAREGMATFGRKLREVRTGE